MTLSATKWQALVTEYKLSFAEIIREFNRRQND